MTPEVVELLDLDSTARATEGLDPQECDVLLNFSSNVMAVDEKSIG